RGSVDQAPFDAFRRGGCPVGGRLLSGVAFPSFGGHHDLERDQYHPGHQFIGQYQHRHRRFHQHQGRRPAHHPELEQFCPEQGNLIDDGTSGASGMQIDTTAGNLFPASTGLATNGLISLQGAGTSKIGILVTGGHTFYGPISLSPGSSSVVNGSVVTTPASTMSLKGDGSS